jgi:hypothetical protein
MAKLTDPGLTREDVGAIIENMEVFVKLAEQLDDPYLERALAYIVQLMERPDIPPKSAAYAIVQLEAIAAEFGMASVYYKTYGKAGTEQRYKKDVYYTARDAVRHLVDSLKYIIRTQESS